jgi:Zn-dependent protease
MDLLIYVLEMIMVLFAIILHEMAHAYTSFFLGDPTPKETGRLTPNPLKHIDVFGLVCMFLFRIGWAKPVRINSEYYKNRRVGIFLVALAGPLMNFILAILSLISATLLYKFGYSFVTTNVLGDLISYLLQYFAMINISLGIFNLIPIPPLDGSRIVGSFLSANAYIGYMKVERYGFYIVFGILTLDRILSMVTGNPTLFSQALEFVYRFLFEGILKLIL